MKEQPTAEEFARVNAAASDRAPELVREWQPGGRQFGDLSPCEEFPGRPDYACWVNVTNGQCQIFLHPKTTTP